MSHTRRHYVRICSVARAGAYPPPKCHHHRCQRRKSVGTDTPPQKDGIAEEIARGDLRKVLLEADTNPMMIPAEIIFEANIPKLGSGKTDFTKAKKRVLNALP